MDAIFLLLDKVLLVAALVRLKDDFFRETIPIVGDVEESLGVVPFLVFWFSDLDELPGFSRQPPHGSRDYRQSSGREIRPHVLQSIECL